MAPPPPFTLIMRMPNRESLSEPPRTSECGLKILSPSVGEIFGQPVGKDLLTPWEAAEARSLAWIAPALRAAAQDGRDFMLVETRNHGSHKNTHRNAARMKFPGMAPIYGAEATPAVPAGGRDLAFSVVIES